MVKTGGQPLLKFILRYLSRHSLNFSPAEKYSEMEVIIKPYTVNFIHGQKIYKKWVKKKVKAA